MKKTTLKTGTPPTKLQQPSIAPQNQNAQVVATDTPVPTLASTPAATCPLVKDTQFWYGCSGNPTPGCNNLNGWVSGQDVTNASPKAPFILAVNCFRGSAGSDPWLEAYIVVTKQGTSTPVYDSRTNSAGAGSYWYIRDLTINSTGTYTATCISPTINNCQDADTFTITQLETTITPTVSTTPSGSITPTITMTSTPSPSPTPSPTNTPTPSYTPTPSPTPFTTPPVKKIPATALVSDEIDQLLVGFALVFLGVGVYLRLRVQRIRAFK